MAKPYTGFKHVYASEMADEKTALTELIVDLSRLLCEVKANWKSDRAELLRGLELSEADNELLQSRVNEAIKKIADLSRDRDRDVEVRVTLAKQLAEKSEHEAQALEAWRGALHELNTERKLREEIAADLRDISARFNKLIATE